MTSASEGHACVINDSAPSAPVASRPDLFAGEGFEIGLVAGFGAGEVARRLAVTMRGGEACHRALAFYLHDMEARRGHHELGFATAVDFARHRLGMSKGRARPLPAAKARFFPATPSAPCLGERASHTARPPIEALHEPTRPRGCWRRSRGRRPDLPRPARS